MPTFTVKEILSSRPWPSSEDTKVVYYDFKVEGQDEVINTGRKPTNPLTVGTVIDGTMERGDRGGLKFVRAQSANGGGPRPRDPKESKRIAMQASHKVAVDILRLTAEVGVYKPPATVGEVVNQVKTIASALAAQVEEAGA